MAELGKTEIKDRMNRIRSGFISQGSSLAAWCREEGMNRGNVYKALLQEWRGTKADQIVQKVLSASGIEERAE